METQGNILNCSVSLERCDSHGTIRQSLKHKVADLKLIRNEFKEILLEVSAKKCAPLRLKLKAVNVHNKFMNEGKASIKFQDERCTMFISNAPPSQLVGFLRTVFVKVTGESAKIRTHLLSDKRKSFENISPVTVADLNRAHAKISKCADTTPSPLSRKRKFSDRKSINEKAPAAKRLYSPSPISSESVTVEQKEILDACVAGHNVFFTGSAGTGKSFLLRKIISALPPDVTVATASTGVAACHIGGITLHQFAGIGKGEATLERSNEMASKSLAAQTWRKCKHLIVDEISMIGGDYFEKIEAVARHIRRNDKPFGGIQLILCGDFLQLPPVVGLTEGRGARFCFQTPAWDRCVKVCFELGQVHRQQDVAFVEILNSIRVGRVTDEIAGKLLATSKQKIEKDGILATRLCSHTCDANAINESKLQALKGRELTFDAQDSDPASSKLLDDQTPVPRRLTLKVGAQVMLLKNVNVPAGLVNGARGIVRDFRDGLPIIQFRNVEHLAKHERWTVRTAAGGGSLIRKQVPLRLAWAFSIHKSQGLTLDCVEMSLARVFEPGQAYVALSRAQSLDTLRVLDFKAAQVWANPDVLNFYRHFKRRLEETSLVALGGATVEGRTESVVNDRATKKPVMSIF